MAQRIGQGRVHFLFPLSLNDVQVGATQTRTTNAHNDIQRASDLRLTNLFDFRQFFVVVQSYCFHIYSSMFKSSGPTKREPGKPQSRKKSPVARHKATLTSLPARISALLLRLALATLTMVAGDPLL